MALPGFMPGSLERQVSLALKKYGLLTKIGAFFFTLVMFQNPAHSTHHISWWPCKQAMTTHLG